MTPKPEVMAILIAGQHATGPLLWRASAPVQEAAAGMFASLEGITIIQLLLRGAVPNIGVIILQASTLCAAFFSEGIRGDYRAPCSD